MDKFIIARTMESSDAPLMEEESSPGTSEAITPPMKPLNLQQSCPEIRFEELKVELIGNSPDGGENVSEKAPPAAMFSQLCVSSFDGGCRNLKGKEPTRATQAEESLEIAVRLLN